MGEARKRKLQAAATRANDLPDSLKFVPTLDAPTNGPHSKKQKIIAPSPVVPRSQDTHLLTLQAEQLLGAIRPKHESDDNLIKLGDSIAKAIRAIPDQEPRKLKDVLKLSEQSKVALPFLVTPSDEMQLNFQYVEPESIHTTGLAHGKMCSKSHIDEIELLVEVPSTVIQEKDYLNHRIHYKVAFYMFMIARSMKSKYELRYVRRKVYGIELIDLQVKYKDRQVIVRLALPFDAFPEQKLESAKNADRSIEGPTPQYNARILLLMRLSSLVETLSAAAEDSPFFRDSILLAERYLSRRSLPIGLDQWATITACLLKGGGKNGGKLLSPNASAMQLFRGTALFLSQFFASADNSVTFGDAESEAGCWIRGLNLFSTLTKQQKERLGHEFSFVTELLIDGKKDAVKVFDKVFLEQQREIGHWDLQFIIKDESCQSADVERMWRTLSKALGERATLISVVRPSQPASTSVARMEHPSESQEIVVGMRLRRPNCQQTMIHGPPANASEAKTFRSFWGTLSELRKFGDGRILETVALSSNNPSLDICQKILALHFPELPDLGFWTVYGADSAAELKLVQEQRKLVAEFEEFARLARDLEDLPLRITSVTSVDAIFASCACRIPDAIDGILQFESSARWPDDIEAMQRMKIAILLALRKPFETLPNLEAFEVVMENQSSTTVNSTSKSNLLNIGIMQLTMASGLKYRLRIYLDREQTLLTTYLKSASAKHDPISKARHQEALDVYKDLFVVQELHSTQIRNTASTFSAYSEAVILLKQWFAAHLLSNHYSDRTIELLALAVVESDTATKNDSPAALFYSIIKFLASWDWRQDCIVLERDNDKRKSILADFAKLKEQNPGHSIVVYPPYASDFASCSRVAAIRMTSLAKASHERLQQGNSIESTFNTPLNHFDMIIHLSKSKRSSKYKNIEAAKDESSLHVASFLDEMQDIYGQALWIFTAQGASRIAVVIEPALLQPRNFKPNLGFPTKPVEGDSGLRVTLDVDVVVAELQRLGEGLITKIERVRV